MLPCPFTCCSWIVILQLDLRLCRIWTRSLLSQSGNQLCRGGETRGVGETSLLAMFRLVNIHFVVFSCICDLLCCLWFHICHSCDNMIFAWFLNCWPTFLFYFVHALCKMTKASLRIQINTSLCYCDLDAASNQQSQTVLHSLPDIFKHIISCRKL